MRAKLKASIARLVNILFPELEKLVPDIHIASVYALLSEFPGTSHIACCHLTRLKNLLGTASKGRYGRDMDDSASPIMIIPGISYRMAAMILAEVGDFSRFENADQILAFAGLSPSTYQSGQLESSFAHMEKHGFRYLSYALFNVTKLVY